MFDHPAGKSGTSRWIGWSILLHAGLLIVLFHSGHLVRVRAFLPGTPQGAHIDLSYLPGGAPPLASRSVRKQAPAAARQSRLALPSIPRPAPVSQASTSSPPSTTASSNDALGSEDIQIALTTYSPSPKPDLSLLPHGTHGEVVLEVTI